MHPGLAPHPGPSRVVLPAAMRDALVAHARTELPNEACGLIAGTAPPADGGTATRWFATRNQAASPLRYEAHPDDLLRASITIDDAGEVIWAIVMSARRPDRAPQMSGSRSTRTPCTSSSRWPPIRPIPRRAPRA